MMTRGQNNSYLNVGQERRSLSFGPGKTTLPSFPNIWARRKDFFFFSECSSEKQTHISCSSFFEGKWRQIWTSMSCDQQIRFYYFCHSSQAQLQFLPSSSLSRPRERCADAVLDWLGTFWMVVSLESLVHCCLLESLGSQRQASLLENKSKWDFFSLYGGGGGGVFNFLAA